MTLQDLQQEHAASLAALEAAQSIETLDALRVKYLGRNGLLPALVKQMKDVPPQDRPAFGKELGAWRGTFETQLNAKLAQLQATEVPTSGFDVSRPGLWHSEGVIHPVSRVIEETAEIFHRLGFTVADGPDIETKFNNFTALNTAAHHPSMDPSDTFWFDIETVLRTQTSPVQIRTMLDNPPPVRIINPGRCYRRDTTDATNERVDYCEPSVLVEQDGLVVGIIGAIGDCYSSIAPDKVEDVYFKTGRELTELVKAESERLRALGADLIVYSLHGGHSQSSYDDVSVIATSRLSVYYDISLSDGYVDLVFEGHTHQRYVLKDEHGVYHLQNGGDNKGISHVELAVNPLNDTWHIRKAEFVSTDRYSSLADDPIVNDLMTKYEDQVSIGATVLGHNAASRDSYTLRSLVAKLYYEFGVSRWGEQYNIVLGGGYLTTRSPGYLPAGEVTYSQLQSVFPFDNRLVLCSIKGRDLSSKFFNTNNGNYFIHYGDYGASIKNNIDPNATYYVIVDSYTSSYAPNRLTVVEEYAVDYFARDLLADYIKTGGLQK